MLTKREKSLFLLLLAFTGLLIGCAKRTPPGANSISNVVDGVRYSYNYWEEGLAILLWHDSSQGGESCSGSGSTEDPVYRLECTVEPFEGASFTYKIHSSDGISGDMWIDDQAYDLSQGSLFLVTTKDGSVQVQQLNSDVSGMTTADEIASLAESDPDIAAFIAANQPQVEVGDVEAPSGDQAEEEATNGNEEDGLSALIAGLQENGHQVEATGTIDQPFFSVPGQIIEVDGQEVQVFEYENAEAAQAEAALISPTGSSIGTNMVSWITTPHFFAQDRLIALYVGEDASVTEALSSVLGDPIAEGQGGLPPVLVEPEASGGDLLEVIPVALLDQDSDTLETVMGDPFLIGYWLSEGVSLSPSEAIEQIQLNLLPNPEEASFTNDRALFPDLAAFDPATAFGPDVKVTDMLFSQGWGPDGTGEAILLIAVDAEGNAYWAGLLYGMAGFDLTGAGGEATGAGTEVVQEPVAAQPGQAAGAEGSDQQTSVDEDTSAANGVACEYPWFMDRPPAGCPAAEALVSFAAGQRFERGKMIWVEATDTFYILFNAGAHPDDSRTVFRTLGPLVFKPGASVDNRVDEQPPAGLQEPVSGFGLLWRGEVEGLDADLRQALGWAVESESGFQTMVQCAQPETYSEFTCYLLDVDGSINILASHAIAGNVWTKN